MSKEDLNNKNISIRTDENLLNQNRFHLHEWNKHTYRKIMEIGDYVDAFDYVKDGVRQDN